jgi:ubiquinone/menaquinone biosynthesis C-methylase UbiE
MSELLKLDSSQHNFEQWQQETRCRMYRESTQLLDSEAHIFRKLKATLQPRSILDIGVGCGRTTPALLDLCANYIGIDYSEYMITQCREIFPGVDFQVADARDLSRFDDGSFDLVVFSYNGLDCISPEDRVVALREFARVLSPQGVFVHSSHNLQGRELANVRNPFAYHLLDLGANPLTWPRKTAKYLLGIYHHYRLRSAERSGDGWAVVNDRTNRFRELMYYITPPAQKAQLCGVGLEVKTCVDFAGGEHAADAAPDDLWIYYVSGHAS